MPLPAHTAALPSAFAGFNALDWSLLLLVGVSTVAAFARGLIRSLIAACGVVLGVVLAAWFAPELGAELLRWIPQRLTAEIAAFVLILAGTYLTAMLIGRLLRGAASAAGLGFFDRLGGAAFGFGRSVLVLAALLLPSGPYLRQIPFTRDSTLLPYLQTVAHGVSFVLPRDFGKRLPAGAGLASPHPTQRAAATQATGGGKAQ